MASIDPKSVFERAQAGELRIVDLRTKAERKRYGAPPGAVHGSLGRHLLHPEGPGTVYLCQHAVRSKLTQRSGADEVAGGFKAWRDAGLPIEDAG